MTPKTAPLSRLHHHRLQARELLSVFRKPLQEALTSVLPIVAIVMVLCFTVTPITNNAMMAFIIGAVMLILGMALFTLGSEMSMIPLGEEVGKEIRHGGSHERKSRDGKRKKISCYGQKHKCTET